jgi:hypothetical protein
MIKVFFVITLTFAVPTAVRAFQSNNGFDKADSIAASYRRHSLQNLPLLAHKLTNTLSDDKQKFRAIYRWVCENVDNDVTMFRKNQLNREKFANDPKRLNEWNKKVTVNLFKTLVQKQKTVCTGYAYLIRELALHAGIKSVIVDGYGRTAVSNIGGKAIPNHSWNAVLLSDKWYLCDATWSAGVVDGNTYSYIKRYDDAHFLPTPEMFALKHYPLDTTWLMMKNRPSLDFFIDAPIAYSNAFKYGMRPASPQTFHVHTKAGSKISFTFEGMENSLIKKIELALEGFLTVEVTTTKDKDGLHFDYSFNRKGKYTTHILFNGEAVFSYDVVVK